MGKPKLIGMFKPYTPNSRFDGNNRRAPWEGMPREAPAAATKKKEAKK